MSRFWLLCLPVAHSELVDRRDSWWRNKWDEIEEKVYEAQEDFSGGEDDMRAMDTHTC